MDVKAQNGRQIPRRIYFTCLEHFRTLIKQSHTYRTSCNLFNLIDILAKQGDVTLLYLRSSERNVKGLN